MSTQRVKTQSFCWVCMCLRVRVCVCVKSVAINCVCLLCLWRDSPLLLCFRGVFATCGPPTHSQLTSHSTSYTLSALYLSPATFHLQPAHLATSARCGCVLCARVWFHLSAISNAASHPAQEHGTARWEIRLCSAPRYAPPDSVSGCHGDWPRRQLQRQKEREREGWVCGLGGQSLWLMAR